MQLSKSNNEIIFIEPNFNMGFGRGALELGLEGQQLRSRRCTRFWLGTVVDTKFGLPTKKMTPRQKK